MTTALILSVDAKVCWFLGKDNQIRLALCPP